MGLKPSVLSCRAITEHGLEVGFIGIPISARIRNFNTVYATYDRGKETLVKIVNSGYFFYILSEISKIAGIISLELYPTTESD